MLHRLTTAALIAGLGLFATGCPSKQDTSLPSEGTAAPAETPEAEVPAEGEGTDAPADGEEETEGETKLDQAKEAAGDAADAAKEKAVEGRDKLKNTLLGGDGDGDDGGDGN